MIAWPPTSPTRPACPHRRLRRLLARALPNGIVLAPSTLRPWASASFVGARHIFPACGAERATEPVRRAIAAGLTDADWHLPGHIVADVAVEIDASDGALRIEMLTVED